MFILFNPPPRIDGDIIWFNYHYYDAQTRGRSRLALGQIDWSSGWPVPVK